MRIRRFGAFIVVAMAAGLVSFFSMREAVGQSVAASGRGIAHVLRTVVNTASAFTGGGVPPRTALSTEAIGFDWSVVAAVAGFISVFALCFSLYQLASRYDELG
jgi:hypothetical protein